ncbi:hypothetical protein FB381_1793 [Nocardioides albertanoniae]|uniref:Uncharacterized protein n=1 Tax=Nocardioides albertanoniae TaxID=1175486 RepID=A0A543A5Q0_9ACTN|nr:hypothetical protein [Nocardioides albertanoniae]TQL67905.1 hypothetical protein FB381_1793 [Nocardioides albertanoniae]
MPADPDPQGAAAGTEPEVVDVVAAAVLAVPGVHALHAGVAGEVATYLPGRRVNGIRVRDSGCSIHVVLLWGAPVLDTTEALRDAVRPLVSGPVDITVEDILPPSAGSVSA